MSHTNAAVEMKSIRHLILKSLQINGESTTPNIVDQVDGVLSRKQIGDTMSHLVTLKLITRRKDESSGLPSYVITDGGLKYLGENVEVPAEAGVREIKSKSIDYARLAGVVAPIIRAIPQQEQAKQQETLQPKFEKYLLVVPKRKPRILTSIESVKTQAIAAARNAGRAEVFGLTKIGCAQPDIEWDSPNVSKRSPFMGGNLAG